ncbi:MAG: hypothetical protein JW963_12470 [Anaerolineales bacterium]|nr:hypothetical protein [Anaerolineales bacterium]
MNAASQKGETCTTNFSGEGAAAVVVRDVAGGQDRAVEEEQARAGEEAVETNPALARTGTASVPNADTGNHTSSVSVASTDPALNAERR